MRIDRKRRSVDSEIPVTKRYCEADSALMDFAWHTSGRTRQTECLKVEPEYVYSLSNQQPIQPLPEERS